MTEQDKKRINEYRFIQKIGVGATSKVDLVEEIKTHKLFAMKKMKPHHSIQKQIDREIEILKSLASYEECPYLVNLHEIIIEENKIYLVLNYISGGDLAERIKNNPNGYFTEPEAHFYFTQLIEAISFLHSKNIIHRDLKLENMLIDSDGNIRIADFGLSVISESDLSTHCGTPYYVAPEIFFNERYNGPPSDIWSLGIVLYLLLCGNFPFEEKGFEELGRAIMKGKITYPSHLSADVIDLLSNILKVDINQRYTLDQIKSHKWYVETKSEKPLNPTSIDSFDNLLINVDNEDSSSSDIQPRQSDSSTIEFINPRKDDQSSDDDEHSEEKSQNLNENKIEEKLPQRLSSSSTAGSTHESPKEVKSSSSSSSINDTSVQKQKTVKFQFGTVKSTKGSDLSPFYKRSRSKSINYGHSNILAEQQEEEYPVTASKMGKGKYEFKIRECQSDASADLFSFLSQKKARFVNIAPDPESPANETKLEAKIKYSVFSKLKFLIEIDEENDYPNMSNITFTLEKGRKNKFKNLLGKMGNSFQDSIANRK